MFFSDTKCAVDFIKCAVDFAGVCYVSLFYFSKYNRMIDDEQI